MKFRDFDEEFNFKKKKTSDTFFILKAVFIALAIFISLSFFLFVTKMIRSDSYEIEENGEKYGNSWFVKYQDQIYVPIPSGGRYILDDVDIDTFKALNSNDWSTRIVGLDKNHVYFGNIPIPDLNPNKLEVIGNGYYTDGTNTYFCSPASEINKNLSSIMEGLQYLIYSFSKTKKPQSYIYPYKKIETDKKLRAVEGFQFFATDGEKVYYEGEVLENADLNTLKGVDKYNEYFADKENVYYQSKLLSIKNSGKLKIVSLEQGHEFLYDEKNGYVFIENYSFDKEKAPYKVIGRAGNHLYHLVFLAKDGVYYYDSQKKKQLKAGDNIFVGNVEELSPNVFTDDENIYYFSAYDVWKKLRGGGRILFSWNTEIYYLDKKDAWEKVGDVSYGTTGAIWKKGDRYYYFDDLGIHQLIHNTIYEISDIATLEYLMNENNVNPSKIRELIENKKLIAISGEKKMEIVVKHKDDILIAARYSKIFLGIFVVIVGIFRMYEKIRKEKHNENKW